MTAPLIDPVDIAIELMRVESTSGSEGACIAVAEQLLRDRGWNTRRIPVTPGRDVLFASAHEAPLVTFSTHLDTVPPYIPPRVDAERLWGRGACDAKGIAAAMICAAERLRAEGAPVALLFVVGEETTHDGAHAANATPTTSRALINGEPTESKLGTGTKGAIRATLRITGRAAHSAYPHLGVSATSALVRLLADLERMELPSDPQLGNTTINIGALSGGVADNVIAPSAEARLMLRIVESPDEAMARLRAFVGDRAEVTPGPAVPPVRLGVVDGFETDVVAFATDIPALDRWGTPYLFGPGSVHVAHTDEEHVSIAELRAAVESYVKLGRAVLAQVTDSAPAKKP